jgi:ABC-type dipeptide/oligopeptide/nickel transport system permease subunit
MSRKGRLSLFLLVLCLGASLSAPLLPVHDPYEINLEASKVAPNLDHPFGTDAKGRDIFSRVLHAGSTSLGVALAAACISSGVGFAVGLAAGYCGGKVDMLLMALVDVVLSFPSLLLAVAISLVFPPGVHTVTIALSAVGWTSFARLVRGHVLTLNGSAFVDAARAMGCGHVRIMVRHIAPLCIPLMLVMMGIKLGGFILTEATLSFLGLGPQPPLPSWGSMISAHRAYVLSAPWMVFFPGMALSVAAYCANLVGESLRERYEVKEP